MLKKIFPGVLLFSVLVLVLAACTPALANGNVTPASPATLIPTSAPAIREAQVNSVDIQIREPFPVQIDVVAHGHLTEACAQLSDVKQRYVAHEFQITILTTSPTDRGCAQVTTPFEKVIPLDVTNLPAGAYTVVVNGVRDSFQLAADNVPPAAPTTTPTVEAAGSINGWLWHDGCPVSGQVIGAGKETAGCVQQGDHYRANGIKEDNEAIIPYVRVNLGAGPCPSIGLAEAETQVTDLSYSFMGFKAGTYCVSIDPLAGSNPSILHDGAWTYPTRQDGMISTTVNLSAGENKFDVNFGWDYTNLPSTQSTACTYRAAFLGDVSVPDNTIAAPGKSFVKTWRLRNDGDCAWGPGQYVHALAFVNGDRFGAPDEVPLTITVPPGGVADVSINMVAPQQPGTYRSEWMLLIAEGPLLGVGRYGQTPLYAQIVVPRVTTPPPASSWNTFTSPNYHYTVNYPADWMVRVDTSVPAGTGSSPEYVTLAQSTNGLPRVEIDALTGMPPFTGYENCVQNFVFRGVPACKISVPAGQIPASDIWVFQRGNAYFRIVLAYQDASSAQLFNDVMTSFNFTQ